MKVIKKLILVLLLVTLTIWTLSGCSNQGPQGPAGASVSSASVNSSGHLILTLTDGKTIDAGSVIGPQGPVGSFADVVPQVEPAIVRIDVTLANGGASGSGTIIDSRGYITTNNHVITGAKSIKVTIKDGTTFSAAVTGSDSNLDLAIIKLDTTRTDFSSMPLGTMADALVGDPVMAMGFPGGTNLSGPATFTEGIISALRNFNGADYIQTDTAINPGNSGGCLFTHSGKMIGIPAAGITPPSQDFEDINLAIPIDEVSSFIAQYVK